MSGHSKWATTKHKKAAIDAKRGKLFAKLIKNIEIAARQGGGDPDGNPSLYDAIYKAKKASMPADNIKRAVKRGSGEEAGGANYEDIVYEGYAPAGVGLIIECLTDNRNRAAAEVRSTLTKGNGSLATSGSVSFNFERKGQIVVPGQHIDGESRALRSAQLFRELGMGMLHEMNAYVGVQKEHYRASRSGISSHEGCSLSFIKSSGNVPIT